MGIIQRLPDELANQIAAGEVVTRPSSIVKELLENALDANATRVVVDIEQGGKTLIRVTDDGDGMTAEDASLSLERHATSKIRRLEDLSILATFGFRGEALPSIASVCRFVLRTRARGAAEGVTLRTEGGPAGAPEPAGGAVGTTIEVRDLFFNVPARRKFLKATATESAHVGDVLLGAALARPDVTFVMSRDGRVVREYLRVSSRRERATSALTGEKLAPCLVERGDLRVEAMLAPPERARAGASGLSLLVNGRHVTDRLFARAVAQAYGSVLEGGHYPVGVVWLDVPADVVDVNVHPQKTEVRFADARGVFDAVTRELGGQLAQAFGIAVIGAPASPFGARQHAPPDWPPRPSWGGTPSWTRTPEPRAPSSDTPLFATSLLGEGNLFETAEAGATPPYELPAEAPLFAEQSLYASLRFVGQVRGTFLICEGRDGLYVLDQHAAAERVTFHRLREAYAGRALAMQRLLAPEVLELGAADVAMLEERADDLTALGVDLRAVGETAVAVHGVPGLLTRADPERIVRDVVAELARTANRPFAGAVDRVLATMACHGSLRAGDAVSREEAEALLRALDEVDFAGHCPHGRPVVTRLPFFELERRVGR